MALTTYNTRFATSAQTTKLLQRLLPADGGIYFRFAKVYQTFIFVISVSARLGFKRRRLQTAKPLGAIARQNHSTMKEIRTEYYFSKVSLTLSTILIIGFILIFVWLSYTTYFDPSPYNDNKFLGLVFLSVPIIFIGFSMRRFMTMFLSILKNRPALILTQESLTDNLNRKTIKWSDIAEIADKFQYSGKTSGHHITVTLKDTEKNIKISDGAIKCKKQDLLETLIKFHRIYK